MNVGFYLTGNDAQAFLFADYLMRSIRQHMPGMKIAQFTDEKTAAVCGVDEVRRKSAATLSLLRSSHYADCQGDWLFLDTDTVIQADIRHLSSTEYDIAVTDRNWPHLAQLPEDFVKEMPYCAGVVFSRCPAFWKAVHARVKEMSAKEQEWFGDQRAMAEVLRSGKFKYIDLPGSIYQYPPATDADDLTGAAIVHYKGPLRKPFLLKRIQAEAFAAPKPDDKARFNLYGSELWKVNQSNISLNTLPEVLRVFIGYDQRQPIAFNVCAHSIWRHSSRHLPITPLMLSQLPMKRRGLTEFTYSRFLVPYLSGFSGYSLFADSDMLCRADVHELLAYAVAYPEVPVFVVQNKIRFEWPSLMLFNNALCRDLTPQFIDDAANGMFDFKWASKVGALPSAWNHLVGYDSPQNAKMVHYTKGIPIWDETDACEYGDEWRQERSLVDSTCSFQQLMGGSVHVNQ